MELNLGILGLVFDLRIKLFVFEPEGFITSGDWKEFKWYVL